MIENEFSRNQDRLSLRNKAESAPEKPSEKQLDEPRSEESRQLRTSGGEPQPRILNRNLFGDTNSKSQISDNSVRAQLPQLMQTENKIHDVKTQLGTVAEHLGQWTQNYSEFVKSCQLRFDRIAQSLQRLDSNNQVMTNELTQKFSRINDRFAERKSVDSKIQEMIDRHNSVLKSFELRLNQMQKLMADKEALLLGTQSALNEAKMEIARLKRTLTKGARLRFTPRGVRLPPATCESSSREVRSTSGKRDAFAQRAMPDEGRSPSRPASREEDSQVAGGSLTPRGVKRSLAPILLRQIYLIDNNRL